MRIFYFKLGRWGSIVVPKAEADDQFLRMIESGEYDELIAVPLR